MRLGFTPMARRDLQDIGDYIARDSRPQAMRFVASLERFCLKLLTHTERYPLLERNAVAFAVRRTVIT